MTVTWLAEACDHERPYGAHMEHGMLLHPIGFDHHRVGRLRRRLRSRSQAAPGCLQGAETHARRYHRNRRAVCLAGKPVRGRAAVTPQPRELDRTKKKGPSRQRGAFR